VPVYFLVSVLGQTERAQQVVEHGDVAFLGVAGTDQLVSANVAYVQPRLAVPERIGPADGVHVDGYIVDTLRGRLVYGIPRHDIADHFAAWILPRCRGDVLSLSMGS